eukprot:1331930-Amphidinium_carterae.1
MIRSPLPEVLRESRGAHSAAAEGEGMTQHKSDKTLNGWVQLPCKVYMRLRGLLPWSSVQLSLSSVSFKRQVYST